MDGEKAAPFGAGMPLSFGQELHRSRTDGKKREKNMS
jgi:hypothetical protein